MLFPPVLMMCHHGNSPRHVRVCCSRPVALDVVMNLSMDLLPVQKVPHAGTWHAWLLPLHFFIHSRQDLLSTTSTV